MSDETIHLFENFDLDLTRGCLLRGDELVHLRPQTYEVLKYLVANRGRLISKDKLIEDVWQGRAVTDGSLVKCVEEVREALGENAMTHIRTVRGRGYIFDSEANREKIEAASEQLDVLRVVVVDQEHDGRSAHIAGGIRERRVGLAVGFLVLLVAAGGLSYWFLRDRFPKFEPIESIAVMPFVNASGNGDVEYLSDGMTEMLISNLSQLPQLSVKARSSVFRYKGKDTSPQQVGRELNVQAVLIGRVAQRGNDLIMHIELVDARTETALWSTDYNRSITNLAVLQGEIARDVSAKLRLRLTNTEQQRLAKPGTENAEAYRSYLRGLFYWNRGLAPGYEKSREFFQQAIDLDPTYALPYSGLADYYGFASAVGIVPPNENWPKAEAAANKAVALDDTLAEPYNTLAAVMLSYHRDWPAAERHFRRGLELNPNQAEIHVHYGYCLVIFGRNEEALAELQRSIELEPLSPRFSYFRAKSLFLMRQYERAIEQYRATLELDSNYVMAREGLRDVYERQGKQREAVTEWGKALISRGADDQASILERDYVALGFDAAVRALAKQELERLNDRTKRGEYVAAAEYVMLYTRLNDKEQAFDWLDRAVQERNAFALEVKANPSFDKLRDDPRLQASLRKVGL